jgi:hypothetical protein
MNEQNKNGNDPLGSFYMGRMRPPPPKQSSGMPRVVLAAVSVIAFVAVVWYAYPQGAEKHEGVEVPLIKADAESYKFKPEDPGGMVVPHQDSTVFDPMDKSPKARVEKLMPQTEEAMEKSMALAKAKKLNLTPQQEVPVSTEEKLDDMKKQAAALEQKMDIQKPVEKPQAKPESVSGKIFIQLGAYRDVAAAKQDWVRLQKKYAELKGLSVRTQKADLGAKGIFYRLQAGVASESRAKEICAGLKLSNHSGCVVVK